MEFALFITMAGLHFERIGQNDYQDATNLTSVGISLAGIYRGTSPLKTIFPMKSCDRLEVSSPKMINRTRTGAQVAASNAPGVVTVTIKCTRHLEFGQVLKVVGDATEVGAWNLSAAPLLNWSEGDVWSVELQLPAASKLAFKVRSSSLCQSVGITLYSC